MKYLVIVESPNKKVKISNYLNSIKGHSFIVEASCGHIRYFSDGLKSIDIANKFKPSYSVILTKKDVVKKLKEAAKKVDEVIIATDQDREGEAIGFHIVYALGLDPSKTKRICFNEITQKAIVDAFNSPREMDFNMFNAQQARSILDLLIGFEISPLLWKHIQPNLSAGRCQSPSLRLVYENEKEILDFSQKQFYNTSAKFKLNNDIVDTDFIDRVENKDIIVQLLPVLLESSYKLQLSTQKKITNNPPAPFITSSIQQEASRAYGMTPKTTMGILQNLYEKGKITYLRTDCNTISEQFVGEVQNYLDSELPGYFEKRTYSSKVANAQEAHECIRPVTMDTLLDDSFSEYDKKIFRMIKLRTIASQMKKYVEEQYNYVFTSISNNKYQFQFKLKKILDIGYRIIYKECTEDDTNVDENKIIDDSKFIDELAKTIANKKQVLYKPLEIASKETFTKPKSRYTEASLIKELEDKGIGRPSTFSNIISTLLEREYVTKTIKEIKKTIPLDEYYISADNKNIVRKTSNYKPPLDKNKLYITELGKLVCNFMNSHFDMVNSYKLTSDIEAELDDISNGKKHWDIVVKNMYDSFHPKVVLLSQMASTKEKDKLTKLIGVNPANGKNIYSYLGKYGPCIMEGEKETKPKYVSIPKEIDPNSITLDMAIDLLKYPYLLGKIDGKEVYIKKGPYGYYVEWNGIRNTLENPDISLDNVVELLSGKQSNIINVFGDIKILNGPYGAYIRKGDKNFTIPKEILSVRTPDTLNKKDCETIIKDTSKTTKKKYVPKKKQE